MFHYLCFLSAILAQQLNPIQADIISSNWGYNLDLYQNHLYVIDGYTLASLYDYDLSNNQMVQNVTYSIQLNAVKVINGYIYVGKSYSPYYFFRLPLNNIRASYSTYTVQNVVEQMELRGNDLFVANYQYLERWRFDTLTRVEYLVMGTVNALVIQDSSIFIGGSFNVPYFAIQERNVSKITQQLYSYVGHNGILTSLKTQNGFLFSGSQDNTIKQWNLQTKALVRTFTGHTNFVVQIAVNGSYLISGSMDSYWYLWDIASGTALRKVNTGSYIYNLLLDSPILYTVGWGGTLKYTIPELTDGYVPVVITTTTTTTTIKTTTSSTSSSSLVQQQSSSSKTSSSAQLQNQKPTVVPASTTALEYFGPVTFAPQTTAVVTDNIQASQQSQQQQPFSNLNLYIYIVAGLLMIFVILPTLFFVFSRFYRKQSKTAEVEMTVNDVKTDMPSMNMSEFEFSSFTTTETINTFPGKETQYSDQTQTWMTTQQIYSIPGHIEIKSDAFREIRELTRGGQGKVSLAEFINPQWIKTYHTKYVILKSMEKNLDELPERRQNAFHQELAIIHYFRNRNYFVRVYGYTLQPAILLLKYYPLGSLENLILRKQSFQQFISNRKFMIFFLWELSRAIYDLHDAGFVHCDIKPQNILLETDQKGWLHPVLTDFGITQIVSEKVLKVKAMTVENLRGFSILYAAPEQIQSAKQVKMQVMAPDMVKRRDIYAIGGLLYGLMMIKEPWK